MLGRLLNTLSYRLGCELQGWRKANPTFRNDVWPWWQRALITAGKNPKRLSFGLLIAVLLTLAAAWGYQTFLAPVTGVQPSPLPELEQYFFTLWTVQATVAAMIYPIVIGFVTLLLQRRHSAKASLQIYLHDSAALPTGLSALFLVIAMGVQYLFIDVAGKQVFVYWLLFDVLWFLINITGVIRFLVCTFNYLRPEQRAEIVRAYAINHVLPAEMRRNLEYNFFHRAVDYSWLPGPSFGEEENNSNTVILIDPFGRDMGDVQVRNEKKDKWFIRDVRLRLLSLAIKSWQGREEKIASSQKGQPDVFAGQGRTRMFVLPYAPGDQFEAKYGLCRTDGGEGLRCWEKWLVRQAYVLTPKEKKTVSLSISDILNGLIVEVQVAMEVNEEVAYREVLEELVDLHIALIQAGDIVTGEGRRDNYAHLEDRDHAINVRMHVLWARGYRRLQEAAVEKLSVSDAYFKDMVHVPGWLVDRLKAVRPTAIPVHFVHLSRLMHNRLNRWWSRTLEEQGLLSHGPCDPATLKAPAFRIYDAAIKAYVGAWESLKNNRYPPARGEAMSWKQYGEISEFYTGHLDNTLYMLFDSLTLGNQDGAEWLCDSLIKWWDTSSYHLDDAGDYIRDERKLTLELSQKPWETAKDVLDLFSPDVEEGDVPKALWAACIHNYWIDLCCVSLYAMILLGKSCECEKSLPARLAGHLGKGKALREGGNAIGRRWPIHALEDLIIAIIRQYYFDGGRQGYRARLNEVVKGIFDQGKPAWVLGRLYSVSGDEDLYDLSDGQLVLMCLLINNDWTPSEKFMKTIQNWGREDDSGLREFTKQLEQWKDRLNALEFLEYNHFFSCVKEKFGSTIESLGNAATALNDGFDRLIGGIDGFRDEQLRDAKVSEERLREVAQWSSRLGFSRDDGDVPVSLFREVQHSEEDYAEHSLTISDMNKGEFVEPAMTQRVSNEDEWFARAISNRVARSVMAEILRFLNPMSVDVDGPLAYWGQIQLAVSRIRKEGGIPILLIAHRTEPRWLLDWTRSSYVEDIERPEGLRLVRDKEVDSDDYVGSLNDIPVFVAPIGIGSSYLISREALDTVKFTEFEDGVFVKVSAEPVQGNDMLINLRVVWRFELELKQSECWRLQYIKRNS